MIVLRCDSRPGRRGQKDIALQLNEATAQPRASQRGSLNENQSSAFDSLYPPLCFRDFHVHWSRSLLARADKRPPLRGKNCIHSLKDRCCCCKRISKSLARLTQWL